MNGQDSTVINWERLARELGTLQEDGETGSTALAKQAIERLLGRENIRDAVDYYVSGRRGSELVRSILQEVQPWSAMEYCNELFSTSQDLEVRRSAVELLRVAADRRALGWIESYLRDPDESIQGWGIGVLDQLLFSERIQPDDAIELLKIAVDHPSPGVRKSASSIKEYLSLREQRRSRSDRGQ